MQKTSMRWAASLVVIAAALSGCDQKVENAAEKTVAAAQDLVKEKAAREAGIDAYIYAYPLVTMELTRRMLDQRRGAGRHKAPMGQFARLRGYPAVDDHTVTAPNADTLYTIVWLDVSKEPWIVSAPDMKGRFFLLPMLDGWTTVFQDPGKRTTGTKAQKFAITGPGWTGTLPAGVTEYKSPTGIVWLLGRIYCTGTPDDYKAVHALQDQMSAVPLCAYGKPYTPAPGTVDPSIDMKTAIRDQVNAMDAATYFKLFAQLLKTNPPTAEDAPMVATLAKIGIVPGQDFDASQLDPACEGPGGCAEGRPGQDHGLAEGGHRRRRPEARRTAGCSRPRPALWHRLSPARVDHRHRPWREPAAGCGLPHLGRSGHPQEVQRCEQVRHAFQ